MLLLDDDDELPVEPSKAEQTLKDALGPSGLTAINEALMRSAQGQWLKVARIVADAIRHGGHDPWDEPILHLHVRQTNRLVESEIFESQGNLRKPRWSEVRLKRPQTQS